MTGNALRIWPTGCRPTGCTWCLTAMPRSAARCSTYSGSPTWSLMQVEYATDLVFRSVGTLRPLHQHLARESVLSVKAEQIASFLGRQISPQLAQEIGSQFSTRIEGT
jgi:hypothetical protein